MRVPSIAITCALLLVGCGSIGPRGAAVIDTWPVGVVKQCSGANLGCEALLREAIRGFDRRDPGHAAIVRATLHDEGAVFDPFGRQVLVTRSGACCSVAVFELEDGSVRAIGVGYPGVSQTPMAIDRGP